MKQLLVAFVTAALVLAGCAVAGSDPEEQAGTGTEDDPGIAADPPRELEVEFNSPADPALLQYVEDAVLASTAEELGSDDYLIDSVVASYVSGEYLAELSFNSQENVYFGYTLREIEAQFEGARYVFALGDDGETNVRAFEAYDDTFDRVIQNVAIGAGVILICVTVSLVAGAVALAAAPAVQTILITSAQAGATSALTSGALGAVVSGAITGFETGDVEASLKAAALSGSEGFKWGAITGVIGGGVGKALQLRSASTSGVPTPRQSELSALRKYEGSGQRSYLNGQEVPWQTQGATRPDVVRTVNGRLEAIEVKNYDLDAGLKPLARELKRQVTQRKAHLPQGSTQRIVLDVSGRGYSRELIREVSEYLVAELVSIDPSILIDIPTDTCIGRECSP